MTYTTTIEQGCTVVRGPIPINDMLALSEDMPEGTVAAGDLTRPLGASLVMGTPEDCERLRQHVRQITPSGNPVHDRIRQRIRDNAPATDLEHATAAEWVCAWRAQGDVGISSECIADTLLGFVSEDTWCDTPFDAADFNRCVELLGWVPSFRDRLPEMAKVSEGWSNLVAEWSHLEKMLESAKAEVDQDPQGGTPGWRALGEEIRRITKMSD